MSDTAREKEVAASAALEKAVAVRKTQVARTQQHLKAQLAQARQTGRLGTSLGEQVRPGEKKDLSACFWFLGLVPGLVVNGLCAGLALLMVNRAVETPKLSVDGESAAFFVAALTLPLLFSVVAFVAALGRAVRLDGERGFWRTVVGYALGVGFVVLALVVKLQLADEGLRMILYRH